MRNTISVRGDNNREIERERAREREREMGDRKKKGRGRCATQVEEQMRNT